MWLEDYFLESANFPAKINDGLDFSMIITDSETGYVVAVVGGVGKKSANRISNGALIPRPPGSTLKPLALYAPYIEKGLGCWSTVFDDVPFSFIEGKDGDLIDYPHNSPDRYAGLITLADALKLSKNSVAARIYTALGQDKIFNNLVENYGFKLCDKKKNKSGIMTDRALAPLALGQLTYGISLKELTGAYSSFVCEGVYREPITYTKIVDPHGRVLLENEQVIKKVFSRDTAEIMNMLLRDVVERGTAMAVTIKDLYDTAGKTGTTGEDKDRLFIGYTPYYVAGIRCGYNREKTIGALEKGHLAIWDEVMTEIHKRAIPASDNLKTFSTDELKYMPFCKDSGELFSDNCLYDQRGSRLEYGYFSSKYFPRKTCNVHVLCIDNEALELSEAFVSLLDISRRAYPIEIEISDSEYVYDPESTRYRRYGTLGFNIIGNYDFGNDEYINEKKNKYKQRNH